MEKLIGEYMLKHGLKYGMGIVLTVIVLIMGAGSSSLLSAESRYSEPLYIEQRSKLAESGEPEQLTEAGETEESGEIEPYPYEEEEPQERGEAGEQTDYLAGGDFGEPVSESDLKDEKKDLGKEPVQEDVSGLPGDED